MAPRPELKPARELALQNGVRFPNESDDYRRARDALLAEEIELRRHIERVAEQRRALPPGGALPRDYTLVGERGPVRFSALFGAHQTLAVYSAMFGPQRELPCPMCTSLLSAWDGEAADVEQRRGLRCGLAVLHTRFRNRIDQLARVGLARRVDDLGRRPQLHHLAVAQHHDAVRHLCHDGKVVGDVDRRGMKFLNDRTDRREHFDLGSGSCQNRRYRLGWRAGEAVIPQS